MTMPLFAHECTGMYEGMNGDNVVRVPDNHSEFKEGEQSRGLEYDVDKIDLNDPAIEKFPSDREAIISAVQKIKTGLNEDQTCFEGALLSPVIDVNRIGDDVPKDELPAATSPLLSPASPGQSMPKQPASLQGVDRLSQSLDMIAEDPKEPESEHIEDVAVLPVVSVSDPASGGDEAVAARDQKSDGVEPGKVEILATTSDLTDPTDPNTGEIHVANPPTSEEALLHGTLASESDSAMVPDSPRIMVQPHDAEIESRSITELGGTTSEDTGKTTARDSGFATVLKNRSAPNPLPAERTDTPASLHNPPDVKNSNWLQAFIRALFVDWIGGFISRLCGGNRKA